MKGLQSLCKRCSFWCRQAAGTTPRIKPSAEDTAAKLALSTKMKIAVSSQCLDATDLTRQVPTVHNLPACLQRLIGSCLSTPALCYWRKAKRATVIWHSQMKVFTQVQKWETKSIGCHHVVVRPFFVAITSKSLCFIVVATLNSHWLPQSCTRQCNSRHFNRLHGNLVESNMANSQLPEFNTWSIPFT